MSIDNLRFFWIFFCFLLSFWRGLPLAVFFTLLADYFFLFTDNYGAGLSCFLLVQLAYLSSLKGQKFPFWTLVLLPVGLLLPILFLGGCYAVLFFLHIWEAIKKAQPSVFGRLYLLGLLLFVCCDVLVAWGYFQMPVPHLVWLFYAPSQFLLSLTAQSFTGLAPCERAVTPKA